MRIFEFATWFLCGFSLAMLHSSFMEKRPVATPMAGIAGGLVGGFAARLLLLPSLVVLGYSLTALALAAVAAESFILLSWRTTM